MGARTILLLPLAIMSVLPHRHIAAGVSPPSPPVKLPTFVVVGGGFKAFIVANLVQPDRNNVLLLESTDMLVRYSEPGSIC